MGLTASTLCEARMHWQFLFSIFHENTRDLFEIIARAMREGRLPSLEDARELGGQPLILGICGFDPGLVIRLIVINAQTSPSPSH